MMLSKQLSRTGILAVLTMAVSLHGAPAVAQSAPSVTTTLNVCEDSASGNWRYSGVVVISGAPADATLGVDYMVQNQTSRDGYSTVYQDRQVAGPATATKWDGKVRVVPFSFEAPARTLGSLRAAARVQSESMTSTAKFAPVLAEGTALVEPVCGCGPRGCVRTQGYWSNKPNVAWPGDWYRSMSFWASGYSWQQMFDMPVKGNAYIMLAHQFMTATINRYAGASTPPDIEALITTARAWFTSGANLDTCTGPGACAEQKAWAAALDLYNNGQYPGGPPHCPD